MACNFPVVGKTSGMMADDFAKEESDTSTEDNNKSKDENYVPEDLMCLDESDHNNFPGFNDNDNFFTSFQTNKTPNTNWIERGPTKPDVCNMTNMEAALTLQWSWGVS